MAVALVLGTLLHIPALRKNASMFGEPVLSTQAGFVLMQGHNDLARGSWRGKWRDPQDPYARYSSAVIPELAQLDELQESKARQRFAIEWVRTHPLQELELVARKLAIYFLPRNYEGRYNPINAIVHGLFLVGLMSFVARPSRIRQKVWVLSPVIASLSLSLIFYVGYRWRYYAEPFLILFGIMWLAEFAAARGWVPSRKSAG